MTLMNTDLHRAARRNLKTKPYGAQRSESPWCAACAQWGWGALGCAGRIFAGRKDFGATVLQI